MYYLNGPGRVVTFLGAQRYSIARSRTIALLHCGIQARKGGGRGLKTGKNVRISFMDDSLCLCIKLHEAGKLPELNPL